MTHPAERPFKVGSTVRWYSLGKRGLSDGWHAGKLVSLGRKVAVVSNGTSHRVAVEELERV